MDKDLRRDLRALAMAQKTVADKMPRGITEIALFILQFSSAENFLYALLKKYAGVSDAVARAIFSGVRCKGMIDYINAIIANTEVPEEKVKNLRLVLSQLTLINN